MIPVVEWSLDVGQDVDLPAHLFDQCRLRQLLTGIIAAFHKDVWLDQADQAEGNIFIKWDDVVDTAQRGENLSAVFQWIDWPVAALSAAGRCDRY